MMGAANNPGQAEPSLVGRSIGHYVLEERAPAAAGEEAYVARDTRLERRVVLRMLPRAVHEDAHLRQRFRERASALARLRHESVASVFALEESGNYTFLVTEQVDGEPLSERLRRGPPLSSPEAASLATQLASALAAAHALGIRHGDLEPQGILVTGTGRLKVIDLGLGDLWPRPAASAYSETETAQVADSSPYLAPEELSGQPPDSRTDLYRAGVLLYEMTTGRPPFAGSTGAKLVDAIRAGAPEPPSSIRGEASGLLDEVIRRAMEKDPDERYQSAEDLESDLQRLSSAGSAGPAGDLGPGRRSRRARWPWAAAGLLVVAVAAFVLVGRTTPDLGSLAVLPLQNATGDRKLDHVIDGITEDVILRLSRLRGLKVIARSSVFRYKGRTVEPRSVARELGVRAVLVGRVVRRRGRLEVRAELVDGEDGRLVWGIRHAAVAQELVALQDEVVAALVARIRPRLAVQERRRVNRAGTRSDEAFRAYLRGQHYLYRYGPKETRKAIAAFSKAAALDPDYALPQVGLADAYYNLSNLFLPPTEAMPRSKAAALRALAIDSRLGPAHTALARVQGFYEYRWSEAERGFRRALELSPAHAPTYHAYGAMLVSLGRFEDARRLLNRAHDLDPLSMSIAVTAIWPDMYSGRLAEAEAALRRLVALRADFPPTQSLLGRILAARGRYFEAAAATRRSLTGGAALGSLADLARILHLAGRRAEARREIAKLLGQVKGAHVSSYEMAMAQLQIVGADEAFKWLDRAWRERNEDLSILAVDFRAKRLRGDPRYRALLGKLGLKR